MRLKLNCSLIALAAIVSKSVIAQDTSAKFEITPSLNGATSINAGLFEIGAEGKLKLKNSEKSLLFRPAVRVPVNDKDKSLLQIDRFSDTWRGILGLTYVHNKTGGNGPFSRFALTSQFEYGYANFKYYPTGNKSVESSDKQNSMAAEIKLMWYKTEGRKNAPQHSPQFRLRYSYDWKASDEVGVVSQSNSLTITNDLIVAQPTVTPIFSPAITYQYYTGKGNFSYGPTAYLDFRGKKGESNPFGGTTRLRAEYWFFFYPLIENVPNVKFGLSPFVNIRLAGSDDFNKVEYGALLTLRFNTNLVQFF